MNHMQAGGTQHRAHHKEAEDGGQIQPFEHWYDRARNHQHYQGVQFGTYKGRIELFTRQEII